MRASAVVPADRCQLRLSPTGRPWAGSVRLRDMRGMRGRDPRRGPGQRLVRVRRRWPPVQLRPRRPPRQVWRLAVSHRATPGKPIRSWTPPSSTASTTTSRTAATSTWSDSSESSKFKKAPVIGRDVVAEQGRNLPQLLLVQQSPHADLVVSGVREVLQRHLLRFARTPPLGARLDHDSAHVRAGPRLVTNAGRPPACAGGRPAKRSSASQARLTRRGVPPWSGAASPRAARTARPLPPAPRGCRPRGPCPRP
ncbi:hypothetical protein SUDANB51_04399 [Streptomyces sp. enrichment culture]